MAYATSSPAATSGSQGNTPVSSKLVSLPSWIWAGVTTSLGTGSFILSCSTHFFFFVFLIAPVDRIASDLINAFYLIIHPQP
jgi:hypothetical protein